ncbi:alpha/beta hydrolase [uncultured Litoreibacter sp.]|uniref:alpha/beta hydrolase n=1 Tax=uncultured Litoreibacter sp. TaxID=1392394 RepID=UPI0026159E84|nr:alpha/beta hydrolase [uncultured Litoreibacter sp.]
MKCVSDIVYDTQNDLAFDLYLPDDLKASACVIYAHGGGFRKGRRDGDEVAHFATALTEAGFAMASVTYRLGTTADAFTDKEQGYIEAYMGRTEKLGLTLSPNLYGAAFIAAMEDLSRAVEYLWVEGEGLGIAHRKLGILGVSAGGIAGLALAYPPTHWMQRVSRPDAVVAISAAIVQPWRLEEDGPACLLIHGPQDRVINISNARVGAQRAEGVQAPVTLIDTGVPGHATQVDAVLDGVDAQGQPIMQMVLDQFARLVDD